MAISKNINSLVINKVENEQVYEYMVQNNLINDDELYLVQGVDEIDSSLSSTSENPVQNKVITSEFSKYETKTDASSKLSEAKAYTDSELLEFASEINEAIGSKANASDLTALQTTVSGKADAEHTHEIADVTGLLDELDEKAGLKVKGKVYTIDGTSVTARSGAEVFNNYTNNKATGGYSHAEGYNTTASGEYSHSEGSITIASNTYSHAEGWKTTASGSSSHAEGKETIASGFCSHAEGKETTASGSSSHAEGNGTKAASFYQHVLGRYNIEDTANEYTHIVGNGESNDARSNAHTIDWDGNAWFAGDVYVGSTSGTNKDEGSKKLATEEFIETTLGSMTQSKTIFEPLPLLTATVEGQKDFTVAYDTFDAENDTLLVQSGITMLYPNVDFTVSGNTVTLTEGVPLGRTIGMYIMKIVQIPMSDNIISYGTVDLEPGVTPLAEGHIHFVYEQG